MNNYVEFDISSFTYGSPIDVPASTLITESVYIDGFSQNGSSIPGPDVNGGTSVTPAYDLVQVTSFSAVPEPFIIDAVNCTVAGLNIHGFDQFGIQTTAGANNLVIFGNHIGFEGNAIGSYSQSDNGFVGVNVQGSNTVIGGRYHFQRNVVSCNGLNGTSSYNSNIHFTNTGVNGLVLGNFIGVQPDGNSLFSATGAQFPFGIFCDGTSDVRIGEMGYGKRNIISGNKSIGILVDASSNIQIVNNYVGMSYDGNNPIPNEQNGIELNNGCFNVTITDRNVISGNQNNGINILDGSNYTIDNNFIGINPAGNTAIPNGINGINVVSPSSTTISNNVISGNVQNGIRLADLGVNTVIVSNFIGTDSTGTAAVANQGNGILAQNTHTADIGGATSSRNVISGNSLDGIKIESPNAKIMGNIIGLNQNSTAALGNGSDGIEVAVNSATIGDGTGEIIIGGNTDNGIYLNSAGSCVIDGCIIGANTGQAVTFPNGVNGILVANSNNAQIGVNIRNVIGGHSASAGILIQNSHDATMLNNKIGVGDFGHSIGNSVGIKIEGNSTGHKIGDVLSTDHNTIGANVNGIELNGSGVNGNKIEGNIIGLADSMSNIVAKPNQLGILIVNSADNNLIGADANTTHKNVISANAIAGVKVDNSIGTIFYRNLIGSDSSNTLGMPNDIGIWLFNCSDTNRIGMPSTGNSVNISGNNQGILIENSDYQIVNNCRIGNRLAGTVALPNKYGIVIKNGSEFNTIGGFTADERNIISGNDTAGVSIVTCQNNNIFGNFIGTTINGNFRLPNGVGVYIFGPGANYIGSSTAGGTNVISGNSTSGLMLDAGASGNVVHNNFFGTDSSGNNTFTLSGSIYGVHVKNSTATNEIGGDRTLTEGNLFTNNYVNIGLENASNQNIYGNQIGIKLDESDAFNSTPYGFGIYLKGSATNNVGGASINNANSVIGCNTQIVLDNSTNNIVTNNFIGNNTQGTAVYPAMSLQGEGIKIDSASTSNQIGPENYISGNNKGLIITNSGTTGNKVFSNYIGTDISGNAAIPNAIGLEISNGATANVVGGLYSSERNVISGNSNNAVNIMNPTTQQNIVSGNIVGVGKDEVTNLGNNTGINLFLNATNNFIGGSAADSANYIASQLNAGLLLVDNATNNIVKGNKIGIKPNGSVGANAGAGIVIDNGFGNQIGGVVNTDANTIANNTGDGVVIKNGGNNNQIIGNSIYNNAGTAIDINDDGVSVNNSSGYQNNIQMPTILQAFDCDGGTTDVQVGVELRNLSTGVDYTIEFYDNTINPDPTGYGEAETFLIRHNFTAANTTDTLVFSLGVVGANTVITASLTALSGNGGTSEMSNNYTIIPTPATPTFTNMDETCQGSADANVAVTGATEAYYLGLDGAYAYNPTTDSIFNVVPGTYTINVKSLNGCIVNSSALTVNSGPIPTFTTTVNDDTCGLGGSVIIDASTNTTGTLTAMPYVDVTNNATSSTNTFASLSPGTYQYALQTSLAGYTCFSDTTTVTVNAFDLTTDMAFAYDDFCSSNNGVVTTQPTFTGGTYTVSPSPTSFDATSGEITGGTLGTTYTISYSYGTSCTTSQTAQAISTLDPTFAVNDTCYGDPMIPSNIATTGGTFSVIGSTTNIDNTTGQLIDPAPGTYDIEYNTGGGCPGIDTLTVNIWALPQRPVITTTNSVLCENENPTALNESSGLSVNWRLTANGNDLATNTSTYTPVLSDISVGNNFYYAYQVDANGCESELDSINVLKPDLTNLMAQDSVGICSGSDVEIFAYNGETYLWTNNDFEDVTEESVIVGPEQDTYYFVEIYDANGCQIYDSVLVYMLPASECNLETYSAFSPNNDNVNDTWIIDGIEGYKENIVYIYNRWGDLINKIENYDNINNVWDGTTSIGNREVVSGTYFYIVEANGSNALKGWVQVVK